MHFCAAITCYVGGGLGSEHSKWVTLVVIIFAHWGAMEKRRVRRGNKETLEEYTLITTFVRIHMITIL